MMRPCKYVIRLYVFCSAALAVGLICGVCRGADLEDITAADYVLLKSLQSLKESVGAVEQANLTFELQNDFLRRRIELMQEELNAPSSSDVPAVQTAAQEAEGEEADFLDVALQRRMEEYRTLADEAHQLQMRISAKDDHLKQAQDSLKVLQDEIRTLKMQIDAVADVSAEELTRRVEDLQRVLQQSRTDLQQQRSHKDSFRLEPDTVQAVAAAEAANRDLWSQMRALEAELKNLSGQWANDSRGSSIDRQEMTDAEAEISRLNSRLQELHGELEGVRPSDGPGGADEKSLQNYHRRLQEHNARLRQQALSLRGFLD